MSNGKREICLCSASESRAALLKKFGVEFVQNGVNFDEDSIETESAGGFVYAASKGKLEAAIAEYGLEKPLLCADSVVATEDGTILRKAKDIDDARRILQMQSGSEIYIISCLHYKRKDLLFIDTSATYYQFDSFDPDDLEKYLSSGEWQGKAGACMVEGFCRKYIKNVTGLESTAMGLQVEKLLPWL